MRGQFLNMDISNKLITFNWKKWWLIWAAPFNFLYITINMVGVDEILTITTFVYYLFGVAVAICTIGKGLAIVHRYFTFTSSVAPAREEVLKARHSKDVKDKLVDD
jgi:hypothetical protein